MNSRESVFIKPSERSGTVRLRRAIEVKGERLMSKKKDGNPNLRREIERLCAALTLLAESWEVVAEYLHEEEDNYVIGHSK